MPCGLCAASRNSHQSNIRDHVCPSKLLRKRQKKRLAYFPCTRNSGCEIIFPSWNYRQRELNRIVDLKYVLSTQVVEIPYEGISRRFSVSSVSSTAGNAKHTTTSNVSESLSTLKIIDVPSLYIVDWDTTVAIEEHIQAPESKLSEVRVVLCIHSYCFISSRRPD
jgi:hypothetical protein